jgi:hypothetical protein
MSMPTPILAQRTPWKGVPANKITIRPRALAARHAAIPHNFRPNSPLLDFPECKTMSIDDPPRCGFDDQNNHAAKRCRNASTYGVSRLE